MLEVSYIEFIKSFDKIKLRTNEEIFRFINKCNDYDAIIEMLTTEYGNSLVSINDLKEYAITNCHENFFSEEQIDIYAFYLGIQKYDLTEEMISWLLELSDSNFRSFFSITSICYYFSNCNNVYDKTDNLYNNQISLMINQCIEKDKPYKYIDILFFVFDNISEIKQCHKANFSLIDRKIKEYDGKQNELLIYFSLFNDNEFATFFKEEYKKILSNATYTSYVDCLHLNSTLGNKLSKNVLKSNEFIKAFTNFSLKEQLGIISKLKEQECDNEVIEILRTKLNKKYEYTKDSFINNCFELSIDEFKAIYFEIINSSYYLDGCLNSEEEKFIDMLCTISSDETDSYLSISSIYNEQYYNRIMSLHEKVAKYSKNNIVENLYDLTKLDSFINYFDENEYNILVNNNEYRINCSFSPLYNQVMDMFCIFTPNNFGHSPCVDYLYGYYTDITIDRIQHIYPYPIDFIPDIKYKRDIGIGPLSNRKNSIWLTMDSFNKKTYFSSVAGSIVIKTKKENNTHILPDCLISIGEKITRNEVLEASRRGLKILHLKRNAQTNMTDRGNVSHHCG